jgi:hypothetical protein
MIPDVKLFKKEKEEVRNPYRSRGPYTSDEV